MDSGSAPEKEFSQERRFQKILFVLKKRGSVSVNELAALFSVSKVTVRADLGELERQGLVVRKYGGASLVPESQESAPETHAPKQYRPGKAGPFPLEARSIAKAASALIRNGDVVFLDGSPESCLVAGYLAKRNDIVVVTTSVAIAYRLARFSGIAVYLSGGKVDCATMTASGTSGPQVFSDFFITRAFFGASGASPETGFTDSSPEEAAVKRIVAERAGETVLLMRSARWGSRSLAPFAALAAADVLVTDVNASAGMADVLHREGVRVVRAERGGTEKSGRSRFSEYYSCARDSIPYAYAPGKGRRIAFANGNASEPFCASVERGFLAQASLAGFAPDDILLLDNAYDPEKAVANAHRVAEWKADVLVEFDTDSLSSHIIGDLCRHARIPVLALEGQIPSAPYVGTNNWRAGTLAGDFAAELILSKFGGWEFVDRVFLLQLSSGGESILLRTEGFAASMEAAFGEDAEGKITRLEGGNEYGTSNSAILSLIGELDPAGRYILTSVNAESMQGALDALSGNGVWDPARFISVSHGCDELGIAQVRGGAVDGAIDYHPERYGAHILPVACALMDGQPVPPYEYVDVDVMASSESARTDRRAPVATVGGAAEFMPRERSMQR
jgi:DeoR family transcriptional regulator of aga operon